MNSRILSLLGLARRAGKLAAGFDAAADRLKDNTARLVVLASDTSDKTAKSIEFLAQDAGLPVIRIGHTMEEAGNAVGRGKTGVLALTDSGFAKKLRALSEGGAANPTEKEEE